jgi:hypothetical protein
LRTFEDLALAAAYSCDLLIVAPFSMHLIFQFHSLYYKAPVGYSENIFNRSFYLRYKLWIHLSSSMASHISQHIHEFAFIYSVAWTPQLSEKTIFLKCNGIVKPLDVFSVFQKGVLWISQSSLFFCNCDTREHCPLWTKFPVFSAFLKASATVTPESPYVKQHGN